MRDIETENYRGVEIQYREECLYLNGDKKGFKRFTSYYNFSKFHSLQHDYDRNLDNLKIRVHLDIDEFLDKVPTTDEGFLDKLEECIDGDFLNREKARKILEMYKEKILG